jgi:hypothetical protein
MSRKFKDSQNLEYFYTIYKKEYIINYIVSESKAWTLFKKVFLLGSLIYTVLFPSSHPHFLRKINQTTEFSTNNLEKFSFHILATRWASHYRLELFL